MRYLIVLIVLLAGQAVLADERPLSEAEMIAALSGRTAISTDPTSPYRQCFDPDGKTTYVPEGGPLDVGLWRITGGQYCSQWGGDGWGCYDMIGAGNAVTWIWRATGAACPARLVDGNAPKLRKSRSALVAVPALPGAPLAGPREPRRPAPQGP